MSIPRKSRLHGRGTRLSVLGTAGASAVALLALTSAGTASAAAPTARIAGSQPSWATARADRGAVSGSTAVDFDIVLSLRDRAGADAAVRAVSTPGSAAYRHFMTPAQFRTAYAPTAATVAAVKAWATSTGLRVAAVAPSHLYVEVAGSAAQAGKLLGTHLHRYAKGSQLLQGSDSEIAVPTALAGTVAGVDGLDDNPAKTAETLPGPPAGARYGVQPCSAYYGQKIATTEPSAYGAKQPYTICGYDAQQYESAFGYAGAIASGNDGTGVTVAITDAYAAPTMPGDANTWSSQNGIPTFKPGQFTQVLPKDYSKFKICAGPTGWYGEETLDIEAVHAMAPGASIVYVGGKDCNGGLDNAFARVVDEHLASVVTDSWTYGEVTSEAATPPGVVAFFHEYLTEAALTGVSALFSSGDDGDQVASTGARTVELPASDSYATAVGGTSTEIGSTGHIVLQTGWSNAYAKLSAGGTSWTPKPPGTYSSGSGGGESSIYAEPFYQQGVVPAAVARRGSGHLMRAVPDISMPGDPNTGLRIGETQRFPNGTYYDTYRLGGTSLSSPLLAGVLALTVQATGHELGLINPAIYGTYDSSSAVLDVTSVHQVATVRVDYANFLDASAGYLYRLQTLDVPTSIQTRVGYDDMTGLGTPNGVRFYSAFGS